MTYEVFALDIQQLGFRGNEVYFKECRPTPSLPRQHGNNPIRLLDGNF
jgi:hypothetical protein